MDKKVSQPCCYFKLYEINKWGSAQSHYFTIYWRWEELETHWEELSNLLAVHKISGKKNSEIDGSKKVLEFTCVCPLCPPASASSTLILDWYFSSRALIKLFCCRQERDHNGLFDTKINMNNYLSYISYMPSLRRHTPFNFNYDLPQQASNALEWNISIHLHKERC